MLSRISTLLCLTFIAFIKPASSADTQAAVMQRMKPESALRIAYQETRYLELIQEPWQASGFLYAQPPDVLVKEQLSPVREIMGANGDKMFYYDPVNDVRHQAVMERDDPLSLNIAAFKTLIAGDSNLLVAMYRLGFYSDPEQWTLTLTEHADSDATVKIIVTGFTGQQANKITMQQPDGDRSEFILTETAQAKHLEKRIQELNQELLGH